jgi:hypothetical protein
MTSKIIDGMKRLIGHFDEAHELESLETPMLDWSSVLYSVELAREGSEAPEQLERAAFVLRSCEWMFGAWATLGYRSSYALCRELLEQTAIDLESVPGASAAAAA